MSATRSVNDMGRRMRRRGYDPTELQGEGVRQVAWPGPDDVLVLHEPRTASSGRSDTWVTSGF
jgi:hypothetical protein